MVGLWIRLLAAVCIVASAGCLGSSGGGADGDAGSGGDGDSGDGDSGDGDSGDGDSGDGDSGDGDGDGSPVDAGPTCMPADPEVLGEYVLAMRPSSVSNYGDIHALEIQPDGRLVELWKRSGVDPKQILVIPGGFFAYINELQFTVSIYRINPISGEVMNTDSITVEDAQDFKVNVGAIEFDEVDSTLTTYDTTMAGWWATSFDFDFGVLSNRSRGFTQIEGYLDPYEGYAGRHFGPTAFDSSERFRYSIDSTGITISELDDNTGEYVGALLQPLDAMMYDSHSESIQTMVVRSAGVTCD